MSLVLWSVTDTDALECRRIVTYIKTKNSGVILLLSCWSSVLVLSSESFCNISSTSDGSVYFEIIATWRDRMRTMRRGMVNFPSPNMSTNNVPTSTVTTKLSTTTNWTCMCRSFSYKKNIKLLMTWTGLLKEDSKEMLWMEQMQSRQLTEKKDVRTR